MPNAERQFKFVTYDVFTDTRFAGNPLAVVFAADPLSGEEMQTVAREFNLSETVFVCTPADARHQAKIRIFTPGKELPFAGHPTIGAAIAIAEAENGTSEARDLLLVLEEQVGPVRCAVEIAPGKASFAEFSAPKLSESVGPGVSTDAAAAALGLERADIGLPGHTPARFSAGVPYAMVPVASLDALARARPISGLFTTTFGGVGVFLYTRAPENSDEAFRARMFAPDLGIPEDPATGSAVAAFAGAITQFEKPSEGWTTWPVLQGVEMGRPSLIGLELNVENGALIAIRIAGKAVKASEGRLIV